MLSSKPNGLLEKWQFLREDTPNHALARAVQQYKHQTSLCVHVQDAMPWGARTLFVITVVTMLAAKLSLKTSFKPHAYRS
jgi:hypothetical protein